MIQAKIIADSRNEFGNRITSMVLHFPRFILAELNTHRVFSRNSASSRAIPFNKMVKAVEDNPFIPIAWQKDHTGMQGSEYLTDSNKIEEYEATWLYARDKAVECAKTLNSNKGNDIPVTKQLCNRLLEPFMWHTVIVTATEWENFFALRCPQYKSYDNYYKSRKDVIKSADISDLEDYKNFNDLDWLQRNKGQAEIHMMALAEAMWDAYNESTPKDLKAGEWHTPFGDNLDEGRLHTIVTEDKPVIFDYEVQIELAKVIVSTARCARVSYMNYEGKDDYLKDFELFKTLEKSRHLSPFEHCARAMSDADLDDSIHLNIGEKPTVGQCRNFQGFIQLRALIGQ